MKKIIRERKGESGNVLFLILIAVALFAALSYAVTQSTRSGGGDATSETNLVNSAQLTQYPAGIRTSMVRMIIGGQDSTALEFNPPSDFGNCGSTMATPTDERCVFHPDGGGATYQFAPADLIESGSGQWYFNAEFEIENIGTSDAVDEDGNDIIAFLPGISKSLCKRINEELGIGSTIPLNGADWTTTPGIESYMDDSYSFSGAEVDIIGDAGMPALSGQPYGCFQDTNATGVYVYYHVLIER